ncbi:MAG: helix-turn-helix domain-containing protein [Propionibacteriaceae bacterium]|jgi:transcriptional regulator with XRE-family HTH domain|nr:helix-turn-helix domain-containing protein [Propionibacteriaceae bacterium]
MTTVTVRDVAGLGSAVRSARLSQGLSQAELAQAAGVGRQWLVGLETGHKTSPPLDMLLRLLNRIDLEVVLAPGRPARSEPSIPIPVITADAVLARHSQVRHG